MATKNIVPRAANEGQLGTTAKPWAKVVATELNLGTTPISVPIFSRMQEFENDCFSPVFAPLTSGAIASGTIVMSLPTIAHPGVADFKSSTSANSGYAVYSSANAIFLNGGEFFEFIFCVNVTANTVGLCGFHNGAGGITPTRGEYFNITGTTLKGVALDVAGETDTGTTYTITQGVWYRARVELNAAGTLVTFTLVTCADGIQVWADTCAGHIYLNTNNGQVITFYTTATTAAAQLASLDWFHFACSRVLIR